MLWPDNSDCTDNNTAVSCINKEGSMRSGSVCRPVELLSCCKLRHIFYCVNTTYLVDRCICPALCRSRQTLEKNVLSWTLAGTGSVLFTRQVAVQPTCRYTAHACACALPLFVWRHFKKVVKRFIKRRFSF